MPPTCIYIFCETENIPWPIVAQPSSKEKGNIQNVKLVENFVFKHKRIEDVAESFDICLTYIIVQYDQGNGYACTKANRHTLWFSNFFYVIMVRKLKNGSESRNQFHKKSKGYRFWASIVSCTLKYQWWTWIIRIDKIWI